MQCTLKSTTWTTCQENIAALFLQGHTYLGTVNIYVFIFKSISKAH